MQWSYKELRSRLVHAGLWPETRMARLACYLTGMAAALFGLQMLLEVFARSWGEHLGGWVEFLAFVASRDTNAATRELLAIPGFQESFVRGVKDIKPNRVKPWRQVRNDG